jgi:hypothetical protein
MGLLPANDYTRCCFCCFDLDGDIDIITSNTEQSPFLYRNNASQNLKNNYIEFKLKGSEKMTKASARRKSEFTRRMACSSRPITSSGEYQSTSEDMIHFGLGRMQHL